MVIQKIKKGFRAINEERKLRSDSISLARDIIVHIKIGNYNHASVQAQKLSKILKE